MMKAIKNIKSIIGQKIERLFLIVWPPDGEDVAHGIDISVGFVLESSANALVILSTSNDDMWSPQLCVQTIPASKRPFSEFASRMALWQRQELVEFIDYEYYEITRDGDQFAEFLDKRIVGINMLYAHNNPLPFGIRILLSNEYIISFPGITGNRIETRGFNVNGIAHIINNLDIITEKAISEDDFQEEG